MSWEQFENFNSSNISEIRYNSETQVLEVTFHNGGIYEYYDVPDYIASAMKQAPSKGQFLSSNIKGHYRYSKV